MTHQLSVAFYLFYIAISPLLEKGVKVLEYMLPGNGKLYHHKMKMLKLQSDTPTKHVLEYLKKKHYQYFMGTKISEPQLIALIEKMKKRLEISAGDAKPSKGRPTTASTAATSSIGSKTPVTSGNAGGVGS
jgi:centrosomal protein CEP19